MKALFDTNVVLDLLLDRDPWSEVAADLFAFVEEGTIEGVLGATTITTIHYLATKVSDPDSARNQIRKLSALFTIAPVGRSVIDAALSAKMDDFEDAVLCEAGRQAGATIAVTRDAKGFKKALGMTILTPQELAAEIRHGAR